MIVVNASPIIILAKKSMLDILKKCFESAAIPESVYNEIMQKSGSPEAIELKRAVESGWISVEKVAVMANLETKNIGQGEKEAISLAYKNKYLLIIDDDTAKKYASIFGVEAHGTFYVIYLACMKKLIDKTNAKNVLDSMIADGFYVSSEFYSDFIKLLDIIE
jgi:predicted nucleic acid-binding protein